uniref:HMG box domain-containing protein n=1 Tax=Mesocestoides corti TaxID=53468 RepID=A0A5K3G036_MESCO
MPANGLTSPVVPGTSTVLPLHVGDIEGDGGVGGGGGGGAGSGNGGGTAGVGCIGGTPTSRRVHYEKWEDQERLGHRSTIAPVLYANVVHPELKTQWPDARARAREIRKLWRCLPSETRSTFVKQARANRTQCRASSCAIAGSPHVVPQSPLSRMRNYAGKQRCSEANQRCIAMLQPQSTRAQQQQWSYPPRPTKPPPNCPQLGFAG